MSEYLNEQELAAYPYNDTNEPVRKDDPKYLAWKKVAEPGAIAEMLESIGIDPSQDKLTVMMNMQKAFASKFHKVDNFEKDEVDYWVKAYDICISDEHAEILEHLAIVMGGESKENHYELQKEFIDIWHFLMDQFIAADLNAEKLVALYDVIRGGMVANSKDPLTDIFINEYNLLNVRYGGTLASLPKEQIELEVLIHSNKMLFAKSKVMKEISWKHWKKPAATINYDKLQLALAEVFVILVQNFILTKLDAEKLFEIYTVKNAENHYRQVFGY